MPTFDRGGLRIAYDDSAHPTRPPLVVIHGWVSKRADLAAVANAFRTSHRVVNIDLPGHGESDVPDDESRLTIPSFGDDVTALCDELDLSGAVLVGHSFGAAVAVEVAVRRPELAAAVVALDGVVLMPDAMVEGATPLLAALRSPAWRESLRGFISSTFLPTDDRGLLSSLLADIDQMPQHVVAGVAEQMPAWDAEAAVAALGEAGTPVLAIDATGLSDLERFATLAPQLAIGRVVGVGHDQMLATPAQPVAMIERFLFTALGRRPVDNLVPVQRLFDAITSGDLDIIDTLVSADFVDHGAPPGIVPPGPDGYKMTMGLLREAMQMTWTLIEIVAQDERVMAWVRCEGRHVGQFFDIPPTGREFSFEAMHVFRVEDEVVREHWAVRDDLGLFRQIGLIDPVTKARRAGHLETANSVKSDVSPPVSHLRPATPASAAATSAATSPAVATSINRG
jgi:pimeloyl-ACP methyl ester carboxylesterase/predicted ester cyclase